MKQYLIIGAIFVGLLVSNGYFYLTKNILKEENKALEAKISVCIQNLEDIEVKKAKLVDYNQFSYIQYLDMVKIIDKKEVKKEFKVDNTLDFKDFFDKLGEAK